MRGSRLLGLQEGVGGEAAPLAQGQADAPLAFAVAVERRRVDVGDGTVERGTDGGHGVLSRDAVGEGLGHVADRGAADGDGWHLQAGLAERLTGERIGGGRGHRTILQARRIRTARS